MLRVSVLAGHARLEILHHVSGPHVDALEDVHLGRDWAFGRRVADDVDQDVVVHLLWVGAEDKFNKQILKRHFKKGNTSLKLM